MLFPSVTDRYKQTISFLKFFYTFTSVLKDTSYLCTGASLYAPYSLLLISNKFGLAGRVGSRWGISEGAELEGENKRGGGGE
jgi:hypothetical protein